MTNEEMNKTRNDIIGVLEKSIDELESYQVINGNNEKLNFQISLQHLIDKTKDLMNIFEKETYKWVAHLK